MLQATQLQVQRVNMLSFPFKNNNSSRLVVRAAEEGAPPVTATAPVEGEAPKPKPPPIGPKRGTKVDDASLRNHLMMGNPILNQNQVQRKGGQLQNQDDDISHQKPCSLY